MSYKNEKIAKMAKRANKRLATLEKHGIKSPAYQNAQARLEQLGTRQNKSTGRRFKESGTFRTKNEMAQYEKALKNFLEQKTGTIKGYNEYRDKIMESAEKRYNLTEHGITQDEYLSIWENLPDNENDRLYGSDEVVAIVQATLKKQKEERDENALSVADIIEKIQSSKSYKGALKNLGLTINDISNLNLGEL